jgi:hypothetical protein
LPICGYETPRFRREGHPHMPGSPTTPGVRARALARVSVLPSTLAGARRTAEGEASSLGLPRGERASTHSLPVLTALRSSISYNIYDDANFSDIIMRPLPHWAAHPLGRIPLPVQPRGRIRASSCMHPPDIDRPRRHASHDRMGGDVFGNDGTCSDRGARAYGQAA